MENLINQTDYYIENRLRKVYPYAFTYCAYVKRRWVGKTVSKLFSKEFSAQTVETIVSKPLFGKTNPLIF